MTLLDIALSSITIYTAGGSQFTRATKVNVRRPVTEEISIADIVVDYEWAEDLEDNSKTIEVGNSIDVYLGRDQGSMYHVFGGRIWRLKKEIVGHVPRMYDIQASGWGKYLQDTWIGYSRTVDTIDNVIAFIVAPLIDGGTLSIGSIYPSSTTITWDHLSEELTMFDGLTEVAKDKDWDFYVDQDRKFYAFPKGTIETSETFSNIVKNVIFVKDGNDIINSQRVIGQMGRTIGSDADYTESASGWASDAGVVDAYDSYKGYNRRYFPDPDIGVGDKVIRAVKADASGGIYLRKTFDTPIDLSLHGMLNFIFLWEFDAPHGAALWNQPKHVTMQLRFETDSSNYFEYYCAITGEVVRQTFLGAVLKWEYGWHRVEFPFNLRVGNVPDVIVGSPLWTSIASVHYSITGPLPQAGDYSEGRLYIDDMFFDSGFYYSFRTDSTSIGKYGERRGPLQYHNELKSNSECEIIADKIILNYKDPLQLFESMSLTDIPSLLSPGHQATITVDEIVNVSQIRAINYDLDEYNLSMDLELSSRFVPTLDRIISDVKKAMDLSVQESLPDNVVPSGLLGLLRGPLGQKDFDMAHGRDNLILNPQFEIDSDGDGIPDNWFPDDTTIGYRSEAEIRTGQYAARIDGGERMTSEYFPIDTTGGYLYEAWTKSTLDASGSEGTLSVYVTYYNVAPTYAVTGSVAIAESINPGDWSRQSLVEDGEDIPPNTYWGRMQLVGDSGTVNFFDDVSIQRMMGVDTGRRSYVRPVEYSTTSATFELIWAETWDVNSMDIRWAVTRVSAEMRTANETRLLDLKILILYDDVPSDTFIWQTRDGPDYSRFNYTGTIDGGYFGGTLSAEFYIKLEAGGGDVGYVRNLEVWTTSYGLKERLIAPFGTTEGYPIKS